MSSKRSGQNAAAMSVLVKSEWFMLWCGEMFKWKTARLRRE
jgi:hypothetical protein